MKICINWKTIAIVAMLILAAYMIWPDKIVSFLPWLIILICPLSMMWMMRSMNHNQKSHKCDEKDCPTNQK